MAEVVNLRRVRKRLAKDQSDKQADLNRAKFGRTHVERDRNQAETARAAKRLDQHLLPPEDD